LTKQKNLSKQQPMLALFLHKPTNFQQI